MSRGCALAITALYRWASHGYNLTLLCWIQGLQGECCDEELVEPWFLWRFPVVSFGCCVTWVWTSLWLVPVSGCRQFPSSCTHCLAAGTVQALRQIHSKQNPKQIALHQGWTWPFILNGSKGKRSEKNTSMILTVLMFDCAHLSLLIEEVLVPHLEAFSAGRFKLAINSFSSGVNLVSWRGREKNSKIKEHNLGTPSG